MTVGEEYFNLYMKNKSNYAFWLIFLDMSKSVFPEMQGNVTFVIEISKDRMVKYSMWSKIQYGQRFNVVVKIEESL